jgi:hypothetical protein
MCTTRDGSGMRWDDRLAEVFDDLEQQAEGLALVERDAEVAEQRRAEYARVDLAGRLHASVGQRLRLSLTGVGPLDAVLSRVGAGWCLLTTGDDWIVRLAAVGAVRGLLDRAVDPALRPVTARLGIGSALRGVQDGGGEAVLHRVDGSAVRGALGRVGADFVEVRTGEPGGARIEVVPFTGLAAVRSG